MSTTIIYIFVLAAFQLTFAFLDLEELKTFNYGIDIQSEPVVLKEGEDDIEDLSTVKLTSKFGQTYQCTFPNTVEHEKQKEEAEKEALETGIPDLLKPIETGPCLRKTKDWWSYEFCYGKNIKQFHLGDDGRIEGEIVMLGYYESEFNWDEDASEMSAEWKSKSLRRYHTQQYVNGTKCDLNGKLRKTEVRFVCEEGSADYIWRLDEPETCSYILTIHTMKICHHPFLKPPTPTQTVTITCNPLLNIVQYQEYLDHLEVKEAEEAQQRELEEAKIKAAEEERARIAEEKAKYFKENQLYTDTEGEDGIVEEEMDPMAEVDKALKEHDEIFTDQWNSILKAARNAGEESLFDNSKTMFKVITSQDDLKDFLKDAMKEVKRLNKAVTVKSDGTSGTDDDESTDKKKETEEEQEEEPAEYIDGVKVPPLPKKEKHPGFESLRGGKDEAEDRIDDPELEELDQEIRTLKEKYKSRRNRLTEFKKKVKSSMAQQYEAIIKEAKEELEEQGHDTAEETQENREAIRHLTKTIDSLLDKLDKTEKDIASVDKELEQFAEYDSEEKGVKSIPPVKVDTPPRGPTATKDSDDVDHRVRVKVSKMLPGQKTKVMGNSISSKQTEELEKSVQRELEKAGLGSGEKIQVKIITTAYDGDDDTLHVLSDKDSEAFKNMIVDMIGGTSEVDKELTRHEQQEENYSFVWGKEKSPDLTTNSGGEGSSQSDASSGTEAEGASQGGLFTGSENRGISQNKLVGSSSFSSRTQADNSADSYLSKEDEES
ncbi:protein OS-9-like [Mya arenaria]|uniref:protein OS-9-like n=1 Tax=Mya arenaria TaxID=6604 RepID=UPI0022E67A56|nr:protein OS-9-like [Mya arenaria]